MAKNGKGQKRRLINPDLEIILACFLKTQLNDTKTLYIPINQKHLFEQLKELSRMIDQMLSTHPNHYNFPQCHL
jgi:hypothetical protein